MLRAPLGVAVLAAVLSAGCRDSSRPESSVVSQVEIGRQRVSLNDTVTLRAIATNRGTETLQFIVSCMGGLDIEAWLPTGERRLLLRHLPNLCDMKDSNILEPGETDTVALVWRVSGPTGTYRLRAGVATSRGIGAPSAFVPLIVE